MAMILDRFIVKAMSQVTPEQLDEAYKRLYPVAENWNDIYPGMKWDNE